MNYKEKIEEVEKWIIDWLYRNDMCVVRPKMGEGNETIDELVGYIIKMQSNDEIKREVADTIIDWLNNDWAGRTELEFRIRSTYLTQKENNE